MNGVKSMGEEKLEKLERALRNKKMILTNLFKNFTI